MSEHKNNEDIPEKYPFTRWQTTGRDIYTRIRGLKVEDVVFVNPETGERKTIIDKNAVIVNFPGVAEDGWRSYYKYTELDPEVCFITRFAHYGKDSYIMYWEIQPDGRYWEDDDGFGGTSDTEITLYAIIDKNGNFTGPFRTCKIGTKSFPIRGNAPDSDVG